MSTYDKKMEKLFEGFRISLNETLADSDSAVDGQVIENLRVGIIERLGAVLDELIDESNVRGVDTSEIEQALKDCIQRIQEHPPDDPQTPR